jgi:hypothetical protein
LRRTGALLGAIALLTGACATEAQRQPQPQQAPPPDVPASLTERSSFTGLTLPPEFDLAGAQGFRTAFSSVGTDGAVRDSWELLGDRLATPWRDDAGVEYITVVDLDGTPVWHTRLPELLEPAGQRPLQPILERVHTADGPDWLVATNTGAEQPAGPRATRVLTLDADTGELGLDFTLPGNRVAVTAGAGYLSASVWDEEYVTFHTLLVDLQS